jgi:glucose 1-dehydrogenase
MPARARCGSTGSRQRGLRPGRGGQPGGAFVCAREAIKGFLADEKPGVVINVSSVRQIVPKPNYLGYSVSKGGMQNLTRDARARVRRPRHSRNGVGPGATITPINRACQPHPTGPGRQANETAGVGAFLASDDAADITGQTIFVDGGPTLFADFRVPWSSE